MDCELVINMGIFNFRQRRRRDYFERRSDNNMVPRYTSPPTRNTAEWMDTFGKNPRMAVIDKISSDLAYAKGKLYRIDQNGDKKELTVHPFLDFGPGQIHYMSLQQVHFGSYKAIISC